MKYLLWGFVFAMLCTGVGLAQPSVSNSQSDVLGSTIQAHHRHHKHHHHHHA